MDARFDLALLDAVGQSLRQPISAVLGGESGPELPAGVLVGFEHPTAKLARYCATLRLSGKKRVNVKVGLGDDSDRLVQVFKTLPLRLDANAAWTVQEAIDPLKELRSVAPIASIEQPIEAADIEGLHRIQRETGIPVMLARDGARMGDVVAILGRAPDGAQ